MARVDLSDDKTHLYLYDGNGNVERLVDAADGSLAAVYKYDPFGNLISQAGEYAQVNPFRFSTKYFDSESSLYYYGYRYYMPETGRWANRDPIGERGGVNLYEFVGGDPVNYSDFWGLAYFALRPLSGWPWLGIFSSNPIDDKDNTEIAHEQLFFEEGKKPANIGFFDDGTLKTETNPSGYRKTKIGFNDCVMRKAVKNVGTGNYCLLGKPGSVEKYNCQDWADAVRKEYSKLMKDQQVKKECCVE